MEHDTKNPKSKENCVAERIEELESRRAELYRLRTAQPWPEDVFEFMFEMDEVLSGEVRALKLEIDREIVARISEKFGLRIGFPEPTLLKGNHDN